MSRRPNLFIVGAPKSGTTSLYGYLAGHPQVYMSPVKEPLYFCPDVPAFRDGRRLIYGRDEAGYLDLFSDARDEEYLGEASTRYLHSRRAPGLVHEFDPDARIIAMLRNPVDMLYALHNERLSQDHETVTDFEQALAEELEQVKGQSADQIESVGEYRAIGRYAEQLERWFAEFARGSVHLIVFDNFAADTAGEFRRVLEFLDIDPEYRPASFAPRNVRHRQRRWVRRILDSGPGDFLTHRVMSTLLGPNTRARLALRFRQSRVNRRSIEEPPLSASLRRALEEEFRPDVARLGAMIGRDLVSLWFGRVEA